MLNIKSVIIAKSSVNLICVSLLPFCSQDMLKADEDDGENKVEDEKVVNGMMDELSALLNPDSKKRSEICIVPTNTLALTTLNTILPSGPSH